MYLIMMKANFDELKLSSMMFTSLKSQNIEG